MGMTVHVHSQIAVPINHIHNSLLHTLSEIRKTEITKHLMGKLTENIIIISTCSAITQPASSALAIHKMMIIHLHVRVLVFHSIYLTNKTKNKKLLENYNQIIIDKKSML